MDRLEDAALHSLTVHPLLVITIVLELLRNNMWEYVELMYRASVATINEAKQSANVKKNVDAQPESLRALTLTHAVSDRLWRMKQLLAFASCLEDWIEEFGSRRAPEDQTPFSNTKEILLDRVYDLTSSLGEGLSQLEQADRYLQIYRQWVSHVVSSSPLSLV